ncbi:hypothetical protein TEA_015077 [Camellia sinensis var. sinensis]|uniref:NAD(P)H dehydrogenase (quinone) n=1 Tax=Camellia sinensis var. sinensis TaxID=542762 RepID=A0A4S4DYA6_CAMSN|nr:hypothetical protein TEA_015077 [Camellia sinensis var. sinensis]
MEAVVATKPVIRVAALCGSLRKGSFNRGLLRSAIQICNESINGIKIEYIEIAPLPMLNTDLEVNGTFPPVVEAFRQKIREADSVLFASPEYNYSVTDNLEEEEIVALSKGLTCLHCLPEQLHSNPCSFVDMPGADASLVLLPYLSQSAFAF